MFNEKQEIIQLYFDVCDGNMVSPSGIPYYDDLYLDVVLLSTGEVLLFDEDELEEALGNNDIAKEQYDLACFEAKKLIKYTENNKNKLLGLSKKYLNYMISLK
jgi:predicted RNA-binding protein associated with RNAse of E/G family